TSLAGPVCRATRVCTLPALTNRDTTSHKGSLRPLTPRDEPILWEILYHGLSEPAASKPASRDILRRPEISKYVAGWGRPGDIGFVAHEKRGEALIGAVWLRQPTDTSGVVPELALAVKQEHRGHGIATALLTQLVRANPDQST